MCAVYNVSSCEGSSIIILTIASLLLTHLPCVRIQVYQKKIIDSQI